MIVTDFLPEFAFELWAVELFVLALFAFELFELFALAIFEFSLFEAIVPDSLSSIVTSASSLGRSSLEESSVLAADASFP